MSAVFRNIRAIVKAGLSEVSTVDAANIEQVAGIIYGDIRRYMPAYYIRWLNTDWEDDPILVPLDSLINFSGALNFTAPLGAGPFAGPTVVSYALPMGVTHSAWILNHLAVSVVTLDGAPPTNSIALPDVTVNDTWNAATVPGAAAVIVVTAPTSITAVAMARGADGTLFVGKTIDFTVTP